MRPVRLVLLASLNPWLARLRHGELRLMQLRQVLLIHPCLPATLPNGVQASSQNYRYNVSVRSSKSRPPPYCLLLMMARTTSDRLCRPTAVTRCRSEEHTSELQSLRHLVC